jgi:adenylate cyclase
LERRLAAILIADVVDYSRLMGEDEARTLAALAELRDELLEPVVSARGGKVVKRMGDGWIVEYPNISDATASAIEVQEGLIGHEVIRLRIGVHIGDVTFQDDDVYGDGINVAARLEAMAKPGQVLISDTAQQSLDGKAAEKFGGGEQHNLKNIARPVSVWHWPAESKAGENNVTDVSSPVSGFEGRPAIAVLPFDNMSNDPDQEYFADGISEDILTRLAMWRWLPVIARNSSFSFKGQNIDIHEIGNKLGVRYLLEGSVRKAGTRVRITGQLIDAETGHHLWADRYDGQIDDIFDLQDKITEEIVTALEPIVGQAETRRAHKLTPDNLGAWDQTQQALWHYNKFTMEGSIIALRLLQPVIEESPDFTQALAIASLANLSQALFTWTEDPQTAMRKAGELAVAAVTSDPLHPMANAVSGYMYAYQGQQQAGIKACLHAIDLNPSFAMGYHALGTIYMFDGQQAMAIKTIKKAIRLSPFDSMMPMWLATLSAAHYLSAAYEEALAIAEQAIRIAPHYPLALRGRPNALAQLGRLEEAREALKDFLAVSPNYTVARGRTVIFFREEQDFQHYMDGLRIAGLPEE